MSFHVLWGHSTNAVNLKIIRDHLGDLGWPGSKRLPSSKIPYVPLTEGHRLLPPAKVFALVST
jgi:hypothetical protein